MLVGEVFTRPKEKDGCVYPESSRSRLGTNLRGWLPLLWTIRVDYHTEREQLHQHRRLDIGRQMGRTPGGAHLAVASMPAANMTTVAIG